MPTQPFFDLRRVTELRDVENKLAELAQQRVTAEDELSRIDILSPQKGVVHELAVHTVGGVTPAGETVMLIVPTQDELVVEARLQRSDIDQVATGQPVTLRFSAFNQRTTPELLAASLPLRLISPRILRPANPGMRRAFIFRMKNLIASARSA